MSEAHLQAGGQGILICDDDATIRAYLAAIIRADPGLFVAGQASDGYEAVSEAERLRPQAIILDLAMPRRSGIEALPELRRLAPEAKVIVFSAFAAPAITEEALTLGAVAYVEKGADVSALLLAIHSALGAEPASPANGA
jgi:DNA-binding NarL/FixJ family response regulator